MTDAYAMILTMALVCAIAGAIILCAARLFKRPAIVKMKPAGFALGIYAMMFAFIAGVFHRLSDHSIMSIGEFVLSHPAVIVILVSGIALMLFSTG